MKTRIITITALLLLSFTFQVKAQIKTTFDPFNGIHFAVCGQAEFIQPAKYTPKDITCAKPLSRWTTGGNGGVELSYHFAKYFGVAIGARKGTSIAYNEIPFYGDIILLGEGRLPGVETTAPHTTFRENDWFVPFKLEFHYPIAKNFYIMAEVGGTINAFLQKERAEDPTNKFFEFYCTDHLSPAYLYPQREYQPRPETVYYHSYFYRQDNKIEYDLNFGAGIYYMLPYGDMIRFSVGYNRAFRDFFRGSYKYYRFHNGDNGTFSIKHDYIYTQLAYIHTFNYEKVKKMFTYQERVFNSNKERRNEILKFMKN